MEHLKGSMSRAGMAPRIHLSAPSRGWGRPIGLVTITYSAIGRRTFEQVNNLPYSGRAVSPWWRRCCCCWCDGGSLVLRFSMPYHSLETRKLESLGRLLSFTGSMFIFLTQNTIMNSLTLAYGALNTTTLTHWITNSRKELTPLSFIFHVSNGFLTSQCTHLFIQSLVLVPQRTTKPIYKSTKWEEHYSFALPSLVQ